MRKKILCFFGTRPEAIKMAPVVHELLRSGFSVPVVVSAQHRNLLDQVLNLFQIKVHTDLNIMQSNQSLFDTTTKILQRVETVLEKIKPDLVLVHGDTTTSLVGSLAAFYKRIPVGHVEAGLRTQDLYQPYPEELNRRLTDVIAELYFTPTQKSRQNLLRENHPDKNIFVTGNTVIDALLYTKDQLKTTLSRWPRKTILMTAHRRENFGIPFTRVFQSVKRLSQLFPDYHWIYPVHPNPRVKGPAHQILKNRPNIHLVAPINYKELVQTMAGCRFVVTDSGGLQEEAPSLGKPVLVLRNVTERPEAVAAGTVRVVGTDPKRIISEVSRLIQDPRHYAKMANAVNPYGDGKAAQRIAQAIQWYFGKRSSRPDPWKRK